MTTSSKTARERNQNRAALAVLAAVLSVPWSSGRSPVAPLTARSATEVDAVCVIDKSRSCKQVANTGEVALVWLHGGPQTNQQHKQGLFCDVRQLQPSCIRIVGDNLL